MTVPFRLSPAVLTALSRAPAGREAVGELFRAKRNEHLLLLRHVADVQRPSPLLDALDLLAAAHRRNGAEVTRLIGLPWLGVVLGASARAIAAGRPVPPSAIAYLQGLAAVAASRTSLDARLSVVGAELMLPDVGLWRVPANERTPFEVVVSDGNVVIDNHHIRSDDPQSTGTSWYPLRRLGTRNGGRELAFVLDDVDPYRDCHQRAMAGRLDAENVDHWRAMTSQAWKLLTSTAVEWADEISAGVLAIAPLAAGVARAGFSATSTDVFGGFAMTKPRSPGALAATLAHELQHSKLNILLRVVPLVRTDPDEARYYAPWRRDPRPAAGLLHGIYAFLGVADVLRHLASDQVLGRASLHAFARVRVQIDAALSVLAQSNALTEAGRSFVDLLRQRAEFLLQQPVSMLALLQSWPPHLFHRVLWAVRNRTLSPRVVSSALHR
jgi:HEXXH motif-containing protein